MGTITDALEWPPTVFDIDMHKKYWEEKGFPESSL